jgi:ketosteroid isomerase-like protein
MTKKSRTGEAGLIDELIAQSERLWLARDLDAYIKLHDDQAILLWPDEAPIIGAEAVRSWYQGVLERLEYLEMSHDTKEIEVAGSWAFTWGFGSAATIRKASGERSEFRVKLVYILRKQADGSWAFYRVIMNF